MRRGELVHHVVAVLVIVTLAWVAYGSSLDAPFVFDDAPAIVNNESIHDLSDIGAVAGEGAAVLADLLEDSPVGRLGLHRLYARLLIDSGQANEAEAHLVGVIKAIPDDASGAARAQNLELLLAEARERIVAPDASP